MAKSQNEDYIKFIMSVWPEDPDYSLERLQDRGIFVDETDLAEFIVTIDSQELAHFLINIFGSERLGNVNLDPSRLIKRFMENPESYIPFIRLLLDHGLIVSEAELCIFRHFGLQVDDTKTHENSIERLQNIVTALNDNKIKLSDEFMQSVLSTVFESGQSQFSWLPDCYLSAILGEAFAILIQPNEIWLDMIQTFGSKIDEDFICSVLKYGTDSHLECTFKFVGDDYEITELFSTICALSDSEIGDDCLALEKLFIRLLTDFEVSCHDVGSARLFQIILSRPKFVKILHNLKPDFITFLSMQLQSPALSITKAAFLHGVMKGFEGPDMFLQCANLEAGGFIYIDTYRRDGRDLTNAAVRYLIHRRQTDAVKVYRGSLLKAALCDSLLSNDAEPLECIQELLNSGVDVNAKCGLESTPIQFVVKYEDSPSRLNTVVLLIRAGADVSDVEEEHQGIIRHALCLISIKYVVQALRDENSNIYNGMDMAQILYKSVLAIPDIIDQW